MKKLIQAAILKQQILAKRLILDLLLNHQKLQHIHLS